MTNTTKGYLQVGMLAIAYTFLGFESFVFVALSVMVFNQSEK